MPPASGLPTPTAVTEANATQSTVENTQDQQPRLLPLGSTAGKGTFLWDGVAGTWFWIDPTNDVVFVGIVQRWLMAPGAPDVENLSRALTYQALVNPAK